MPCLLLPALLLSTAARAHVSHDVATDVAVPADLALDGTWLVLSNGHVPLAHVRDERGSFGVLASPAVGDRPTKAAQLADGTLVLVGASGLWWSQDLESWEQGDAPSSVDVATEHQGQLALGGPWGAWLGPPGELEQVFDQPVRALTSGGILAAVDTSGGLWRWDEGGWTELPAVDEVGTILATPTDTWVGTRGGRVLRLDGDTWLACGTVPGQDQPHSDVVALAVDGVDPAVLWAGTGVGGPFRSGDACVSWEDRGTGSPVDYEGEGHPSDETLAVTALRAFGDQVLLAGWNGVFLSQDAGQSWVEPTLLPADYLRGLAVRPGPSGQPVVYLGPYASGPLRTPDQGQTWSARNLDLSGLNVQRMAADAFDPDLVYAVVGHRGYFSRDGGATWAATDPDQIGQFDPDEAEPDHVWAHGGGQIIRSTTGGVTWAPIPDLPAKGRFVGHLRPDGSGECVVASSPSELWCDQGSGWTLLAELEGTPQEAVSTGPAVLIAATDTVYRVVDGGSEPTLGPLDADRVLSLAVADDGTAFAGTLGGVVYRSQDKGQSWELLSGRVGGTAWNVAPLPDFAQGGDLLLGTLDGSYVMHAAGGDAADVQLERWAPLQRVDDTSGFLTRSGCGSPSSSQNFDYGTFTELVPGCSLRISLRGEEIEVLGTSQGQGQASLLVDGEEVRLIGDEVVPSTGPLATVQVEWGWHQVEVVGLSGAGVRVDALLARAIPAEEEPPADTGGDTGVVDDSGSGGADSGAQTPDEEQCGCSTGGGSAGLWVLLGLLGARRRTKRTQSAACSTTGAPRSAATRAPTTPCRCRLPGTPTTTGSSSTPPTPTGACSSRPPATIARPWWGPACATASCSPASAARTSMTWRKGMSPIPMSGWAACSSAEAWAGRPLYSKSRPFTVRRPSSRALSMALSASWRTMSDRASSTSAAMRMPALRSM